MAGSEEKLLFQNRKASYVPRWTPLAPMEEEKDIYGGKKTTTKTPLNQTITKPRVFSLRFVIPAECMGGQRRALGHLSLCLFF